MYPRRELLIAAAFLAGAPATAMARGVARDRDVPFLPTPPDMVEAMLDLAKVGPDDRLIDLGAGDGRIALAAARRGARALGIEIDAALVARARQHARDQGLADRADFRAEDLFTTPLRPANVVTLYLLPAVNLRLRPRLLTELAPGSRVVSHAFDMRDWRPDRTVVVDDRRAFLWIVPAVAGGDWLLREDGGRTRRLTIEQRFQDVSGTLDGASIAGAGLTGRALAFTAGGRRYAGQVGDAAIAGEGWRAERAG